MNDSLGAPASLVREVPRSAAVSGLAGKRRPIVVVVGPQHSGTSLCAYALSLLGVDMTDADPARPPAGANASVRHGNGERPPVTQFHDRILGLFNRAAPGPLDDFALPVAWWADPRVVPLRREIAAFLEARIAGGCFGFADPCTVRLLPLWQQIFTEFKLLPKIVLCLRNPAVVSRSLHDRDGLDPDLAEYRWFVHMTDFFRYAGRLDYCTVEYEDWFDNASANLDKLQKFLDLEWQQSEADRDLALSRIAALADPAAEIHGPEPQQPIVRSFYKLARGSVDGAGEHGRREQIVQQFVAFQQLQKPIERAWAAHAAASAEVTRERDRHAAASAALGAELASARSGLAERDAALGRAQARLPSLQAAIAEREQAEKAAQARLDETAAVLTATRSKREATRSALAESEAARDALQAVLAAARQELAEAQRAGQERATALEAARQSLHADIAEREQANAALQARLDQADAVLAATQAEREALQALAGAARQDLQRAQQAGDRLRSALRRAEQDGQNGAAAAAALQREIAGLRGALADAAQQAARQNAEQEATGGEIAALRSALTAARQVGKAAMQALAAAIPAPPVERIGWLRAIKRQLGLVAR